MSFSSDVKKELSEQLGKSRHCKLAELMAFFSADGKMEKTVTGYALVLQTENQTVAQKAVSLYKKIFQIELPLITVDNSHIHTIPLYQLRVETEELCKKTMQALKLMDAMGVFVHAGFETDGQLIQESCCKRAFLRGAFLASGSISNPEKSYHFEIVCNSEEKAEIIQKVCHSFDLDAKIVERKKSYVVYLKEGAQIVDVLNIMGAHVALMNLENVRILKEMRNSVNRKVNCETANINKVVNAAVRQIEDINLLIEHGEYQNLPITLQEMADIRLEYPDSSLKELGELLDPPVGKSGVNHRLRKLSELAEKYR